jgi:hypothetical protein
MSPARRGAMLYGISCPEIFLKVLTISKTDVPFPVPKLIGTQPLISLNLSNALTCP